MFLLSGQTSLQSERFCTALPNDNERIYRLLPQAEGLHPGGFTLGSELTEKYENDEIAHYTPHAARGWDSGWLLADGREVG